jgi:hypothetical protein
LVGFTRDQILQEKKIKKQKDSQQTKADLYMNSTAQGTLDLSTGNAALDTSEPSFFHPELLWTPGYFEAVQHLNEKYGIIKDSVDFGGNKQIVYDRLINEACLVPQIQPFQSMIYFTKIYLMILSMRNRNLLKRYHYHLN